MQRRSFGLILKSRRWCGYMSDSFQDDVKKPLETPVGRNSGFLFNGKTMTANATPAWVPSVEQTQEAGILIKNYASSECAEVYDVKEKDFEWLQMWNLPVNNEEGKDDKFPEGFEEHAFLSCDPNQFPDSEPIKAFMSTVLMGLQRNPYLTVQEKKDRIAFNAEYLKKFSPETFNNQ